MSATILRFLFTKLSFYKTCALIPSGVASMYISRQFSLWSGTERGARTECWTKKLSKQRDNTIASNVASWQKVVMSFQLTLGEWVGYIFIAKGWFYEGRFSHMDLFASVSMTKWLPFRAKFFIVHLTGNQGLRWENNWSRCQKDPFHMDFSIHARSHNHTFYNQAL